MAPSPSLDCPDCGSPDTTALRGHRGDLSPGERCDYVCHDCGAEFVAVMPEPSDGYDGDGVFAENH